MAERERGAGGWAQSDWMLDRDSFIAQRIGIWLFYFFLSQKMSLHKNIYLVVTYYVKKIISTKYELNTISLTLF